MQLKNNVLVVVIQKFVAILVLESWVITVIVLWRSIMTICKQNNKRLTVSIVKCGTCQYFDQCKAEHVVVYNDPYCSGLKQIIKFYKNIKNTTYNSI